MTQTLPFASSFSPSTLVSFPFSSLSVASTELDTGVDWSIASTELSTGVELVVPPIACEEKENKDMVTNLRTKFKERQRRRLSESITVISPPSKRLCLEPLCPKPILVIAPVPEPSAATASTNPMSDERLLSVDGTSHQKPERLFFGPEHLSDDSVEYAAFVSLRPKSSLTPNQEKIVELIR